MTRLKPHLPLAALLIGAAAVLLILVTARIARAPLRTDSLRERPLILYLAPASGTPHSLYALRPAAGETPLALVDSALGILAYAPAPDGTRIAFSEINPTGGADLRLYDLASGAVTTLAVCPEAECTAPAWHPDGTRIAYERTPLDPAQTGAIRPTRIRIITLATDPPADAPLFADETLYSYGPLWSPDGALLAAYEAGAGGILLYDAASGETGFLSSRQSTTGAFSPDGTRLVYPDIDFVSESTFYTHLRVANLATGAIRAINSPESPADDERAIWSPDGATLVVSRRYMDDRYTPGRQLYLLSPETGDTKPLVVDAAYTHGAFAYDPAGERLVIQRLRMPEGVGAGPAAPEVWLYGLADQSLVLLAEDAFLPAWLP